MSGGGAQWLGSAAGGVLAAILAALPAAGAVNGPAAIIGACAAPQYRQFDFWLGEWTVVDTATGAAAGDSRIEAAYGGCGVRENWRDPDLTGGSLNTYDRSDRLWHQVWIDSSGARREFIGGREGEAMVLVSTHPSAKDPNVTIKERMRFTANADGSVRQFSDASRDGGANWVSRYDYTYRPKRRAPLVVAPAPAVSSAACASAEYRQFDFWVGRWNVYQTGKDKPVSHSLIESLYGGCGLRETWLPLRPGGDGGSLNIYLPGEKAWRQTWIDASGARVDFTGGWKGSAMVLTGFWKDVLGPGKDALVRMTYTRSSDRSVRQLGETSEDRGATWSPSFDFTYRPSAG